MYKKYLFLMLFFTSFLSFSSPLPADAVFQVKTSLLDPNTFSLNWSIKKGYFLYKKSISLVTHPDSNFNITRIPLPDALEKKDARGKTYAIYRNQLIVPVSVLGVQPGEGLLDVHYQGCSNEGFCYPPQHITMKLTIDNQQALSDISIETTSLQPNTIDTNQDTELEKLFSTDNWLFIILSFYGFGLLLAFTPCVLPMIPVLSGIIIGHGKNMSTSKAFLLSLSYVLSMSVTYSVIGAVIALMGSNLQASMQSSWAIGSFSLLFFMLALAMFNVYELRLPQALQNKMASLTRSRSGGHYLNAALMGCLSILILSPCVTAPLIGALGYIANKGNISFGILTLFFLGLGMGTPLLLIGTSAGKLLPKAGPWMNEVKAFFGVLLLAVAIYLLSRLLPSIIIMGLWSCLLIFSGIYLGALNHSTSNIQKFNQGAGLILLVYGFLILIGASQGNSDPMLPLKSTSTINPTNAISSITVKTLKEAKDALAKAQQEGKPVMVDFYADWCESCKIMEKTTLSNPMITNRLSSMVVIKADVTKNNAQTDQLLNFFKVIAPPTFLFFNAHGRALDKLQLVGEISVDNFIDTLNKI